MSLLQAWGAYRAFQTRPAAEHEIVFYAETRQDWHHFSAIIDRMTQASDTRICYLTSDPDDPVLEDADPRFGAHYVPSGWALSLCFLMLRARVCVLTMMDLGNFQLKRSVFPVHYVYVFHSLGSTHMVDHANSYDHYDTLLCAGPHQAREIRRREQLAGLPAKELVPHGYARLERLMQRSEKCGDAEPGDGPIQVLVAPTWGPNSILPVCGEALLGILLDAGFRVVLRPHYETLRQTPRLVRKLLERFADHSGFVYIDAMAESESLLRSHVLITDWSAIALEYVLGLRRPVLFVDVPPRVRNPEFETWQLEPVERSIRDRVGDVVPVGELREAPGRIRGLMEKHAALKMEVHRLRTELVYNLGESADAGAHEILRVLARVRNEPAVDASTSRP